MPFPALVSLASAIGSLFHAGGASGAASGAAAAQEGALAGHAAAGGAKARDHLPQPLAQPLTRFPGRRCCPLRAHLGGCQGHRPGRGNSGGRALRAEGEGGGATGRESRSGGRRGCSAAPTERVTGGGPCTSFASDEAGVTNASSVHCACQSSMHRREPASCPRWTAPPRQHQRPPPPSPPL